MGSERRVGLRRAAHTIFALVSVLPLLLFLFFMWHFDRLKETTAQVGVLLALLIAMLGFVIFRQMVDRISANILDLNRVVEGQAGRPEGRRRASVVGGAGARAHQRRSARSPRPSAAC